MSRFFWAYANAAAVAAMMLFAGVAGADNTTQLVELSRKLEGTSLLFLTQRERELAFKRIDQLLPTREIDAGDDVRAFEESSRDLGAVPYSIDGTGLRLNDFLQMPESRGLIVWQDGKVLMEYYAPGHDADTRWISFSIAKSVTSMLIGAAIKDGYIDSVDDPVSNYLPSFRGTTYENVTIKHVLQMASGVRWNEDYADPESDVARAGAANGVELVHYLAALERAAPPGELFNYNTGESNLAGEILRAAIGGDAAAYLSRKIWKPFGMQSSASWRLGKAGGGETGGCCINATLRDYARLGIFALGGGRLADGTAVLPDNWMQQSTTPSAGADFYGYLWWLDEEGSYRGRGIFGQQIFIDPASSLVIAVHSNAPAAVDTPYHDHLEAVMTSLAQTLER